MGCSAKRTRTALTGLIMLLALAAPDASNVQGTSTQQAEHHAGLVLQFADGAIETYCVPFSGDSISGLDLLLKTGLDVQIEAYGGMGAEVCKIGRDGCDYPNQPCACQSFGTSGKYWSYHHLKDGKWVSSIVGAGGYKVHDGDVEGWAWSDGKPPALSSYTQVCAATQPKAANTAQTHPPTPTRALPRPTSTKRPPVLPPTPIRPRPLQPVPTTMIQATLPTITPPQFTSTQQPAIALSPTLSLTGTPILTATQTAVPTPPTPTPSDTPTEPPTTKPAASPTPNAQRPTSDPQESLARSLGIAIGAVTILGLVAWAVLVRLRRSSGGQRVE